MADGGPKMTLQREVSCFSCLDYVADPYTANCGHYFCRICMTQCLMESPTEATCPQCGVRIQPQNFTLNRDEVRFVEISKQLRRCRDWEAEWKDMCRIHREPLKYFCKNDQVRVCPACNVSKGHVGHDTIPVEEAAAEMKKRILACLDHVKNERDNVTNYKNCTENQHVRLRGQLSDGKEKIMTAFKTLREFVTRAELLVRNEFITLEKEIGRTMEENVSQASEKISYFEHILEKMAEMCRLPEDELLQCAGKNLQKWERERFDKSAKYPAELKWRIWDLCDLHYFMKVSVKHTRALFEDGFHLQYRKVNVTLNPATAHPRLAVSEDFKEVKWAHQVQAVFDNPRRFDICPCVLGCEGFDSGKVYWEVDIGIEGSWAIGVAKETLECKGEILLNSGGGVYAIGKCGDRYFAFEQTNVPFPWKPLKPMRIRISLDYMGAGLVFSDAEQAVQLFEFREQSFDDEVLYPFFWIQTEGQLKIHT